MIKIIFLIFSLMTVSSLYAKDRAVSEDHQEKYCPKDDNWHFHCDPEEEMRKEEKKTNNKPTQNQLNKAKPILKPMDIIKKRREDYENAHADFLLNPDNEAKGIKYLMARQKMLKDVSLAVAKEQEIKWKYGNLNYENIRPTSSFANKIYKRQRFESIEDHTKNLKNEYGLIYFYASWCHICKRFSPILKNFTDNYQVPISSISVDGGKNDYFTDYKIDNGQADNFGVTHYPTLLLYNSKTNSSQIVGTGFVPIDELKERIYLLTKENAKNAY